MPQRHFKPPLCDSPSGYAERGPSLTKINENIHMNNLVQQRFEWSSRYCPRHGDPTYPNSSARRALDPARIAGRSVAESRIIEIQELFAGDVTPKIPYEELNDPGILGVNVGRSMR